MLKYLSIRLYYAHTKNGSEGAKMEKRARWWWRWWREEWVEKKNDYNPLKGCYYDMKEISLI